MVETVRESKTGMQACPFGSMSAGIKIAAEGLLRPASAAIFRGMTYINSAYLYQSSSSHSNFKTEPLEASISYSYS